jgi:hypothetical protein
VGGAGGACRTDLLNAVEYGVSRPRGARPGRAAPLRVGTGKQVSDRERPTPRSSSPRAWCQPWRTWTLSS